MRKQLLLWTPLAVLLLFIGLFASGLLKPDDRIIASGMVGKPLPEFNLPPGASDRPGLSSRDFAKGQPRLLNIFASWCVPCIAEVPQLAALKAQGVMIDAVAIRDARPDVDRFLARWGNPYARIGLDERSLVQMSLGSSGYPETFVVDGKGIIRYQHIGAIYPHEVAMILEKLREAS